MDDQTKALIESLQAVSRHAEPVANALMLGNISPAKQREYAQMLTGLGDLLRKHADREEGPATSE
ncbi:hypothetical protein ACIRSS_50070 [Amycolatopsis sp. NPDC101161]|uniref:hypothetical protein n=1 Tax=Amycolatopsis sp. NPDC101161 TaxID=3363940 RepID=UPI00382E1CBA